MMNEIAKYIRICFDCQKMRIQYHKLYEKLISISSNDEQSFHIMTLNFVINMFFTKNLYIDRICDNILMFVNKLTKHATYIVFIKNLNVEKLANIM